MTPPLLAEEVLNTFVDFGWESCEAMERGVDVCVVEMLEAVEEEGAQEDVVANSKWRDSQKGELV